MKFERLTVAFDFSPASSAALRHARALARRGTRIALLPLIDTSVFRPSPPHGDPAVVEHLYADLIRGAGAELEVHAEELRASGAQVEVVVVPGRPADEILARSQGADVVCVGTHARGAIGRLFLGSVAEEIARLNPAP